MAKYNNQNVAGLQNLGFDTDKHHTPGGCAICENPLTVKATRISPVEVIDLFCCESCGRIYTEGALGLLVQVGRRAKPA